MNELEKELIKKIIENDLPRAKSVAHTILLNSKTKKDEEFCKRMIARLEAKPTFLEIPSNIQGCLTIEDVSFTFNENRYFLKEKELFEKIQKIYSAANKLEELGIEFTNSCLLYGESGTGKTTFGKYVAYKMGLPFAYLNFSFVIDSLLGNTGKNIARCFEYVKKQKCVFMIDEIDTIGKARGENGEVGEMNRVVINLMQCIDSLPNSVLLLGATNRKDILDKALLRRFFHKHKMCRLDQTERIELCRNFFSDIKFPINEEKIFNIAKPEQTQSELINNMVILLAKHFSE